jgi:hypothetical protein
MFCIPSGSNKDRGFHIDFSSEEGQEYLAVGIIGKDRTRKCPEKKE